MSEINGVLVECPDCARIGKKQILGRVLDNGDLLVLRFHHGTTMLRALEYSLLCGCGYSFNIMGTTILPQALNPSVVTYTLPKEL